MLMAKTSKRNKYLYFLLSRKQVEPGIQRVLTPSLNSSDLLTVFKMMAQNTRLERKN